MLLNQADILIVILYVSKSRAKVSKYGDRVLETIESVIKEHNMKDKNSSSSNESTDSVKRRRGGDQNQSPNIEDFEFNSTGRSKKMATKKQNKVDEAGNRIDRDYCSQYIDDDLDFEVMISKQMAQ